MSIYIKESGTWKEITGTNRPYAKVSGEWQGMTNAYTKVSGVWQPVYQYDNTAPTIPQPTVALTSGTVNTVYWTAITDDITGVASATVYQRFFGSSTGLVSGASFALSSFGAGSTTFAIPSNRRNTPSGETWVVSYYIAATDNAGNSDTGDASSSNYTKPLGTYTVTTTGHGTWTLAQGSKYRVQ
jgi:hypothetical protein